MEQYSVLFEDSAEQDLRDIAHYISAQLGSPKAALNLVYRIKEMADGLSQMPLRFPLYQSEPWRSKGLRRFNVGNFATFYKVDSSKFEVVILAVMYGGRDIDRVLNEELDDEDSIG
jgi:toxin ParE1/3/4